MLTNRHERNINNKHPNHFTNTTMAFKNEESIISNEDDDRRRRNSTTIRSRRSATTSSNPSHQMSLLQLTRNGASFLTGSMLYLADESVPGHYYHRGAQDGRQIDGRCLGFATQDFLAVMPSPPPSIRVGRAGHRSSVRSHANCNIAEIIDAALRIINDDQEDNHGEQEQCLLWHRSPCTRPRNGSTGSRHPEENDGRRASNEEEARRSMQRQSPQ